MNSAINNISDFKKGIIVPESSLELFLEKHNWTYHQIARNEFPLPYTSLDHLQLACICDDPVLWCSFFLRNPDNTEKTWQFWDYQEESVRYAGNTIHECGAEVGKTREIIGYILWKVFTTANGSGLVTAPMFVHLLEIVDAITEQLRLNKELKRALIHHRKHPHHHLKFSNGFTIDFRPTGHDGEALRGVHVNNFAIVDEASKIKNYKVFSEFWRAMKPGCVAKIYSVPDGDRSCEFYRLCQRADGKSQDEEDNLLKNMTFKKFHWSKTIMPYPFWSDKRKQFYLEQYGGENSPGYQHNVMGNWGDPENSVFPWFQFQRLLKDIHDYRCLKIQVNDMDAEVTVKGIEYRAQVTETKDIVPEEIILINKAVPKTQFDIRGEIKSFFSNIPGLKFGGADLGFSQDPTEILVKLIMGRTHRVIARVQLKGVSYDQQADAIDALDDIFDSGEQKMGWGVDFGNAGSAVVHILQGQEQYFDKMYEDRLTGYQFGATYEAVNEGGEIITDKHTGKPVKLTGKELSTDLLVKKMQRIELEYPHDPDIILYYPNHTYREGDRHRIYKKEDDHIIDADRVLTLRVILPGEYNEDLFA